MDARGEETGTPLRDIAPEMIRSLVGR